MLVNLAFSIAQMALVLAWNLSRWLFLLLGVAARWVRSVLRGIGDYMMSAPDRWVQFRRSQLLRRLNKARGSLPLTERAEMGAWSQSQALSAIVMLFTAWGRGQALQVTLPWLVSTLNTAIGASPLRPGAASLPEGHDKPFFIQVRTASLAEQLAKVIPPESLPELVFCLDNLMLQQGPKTRLQEEMLEVFCDFAGLKIVN